MDQVRRFEAPDAARPRREASLPLLGAALDNAALPGSLLVYDRRGRMRRFGEGGGTELVVRLTTAAVPLRIAANPVLGTAEAYMDGGLVIEQGTIRDLLMLISQGFSAMIGSPMSRLVQSALRSAARVGGRNGLRRSRLNASRHYDLPPALYELFLDADRIYSCAYFRRGDETLETAQADKHAHIARKLRLEPGSKVLDIGCGWGALARMLADRFGADVTGISLSHEQIAAARERGGGPADGGRARFELRDYRAQGGRYDRIVSVGMLEHVGRRDLPAYFGHVARLLDRDGVALIHSIGRAHGSVAPDRFVQRYVFPGGYIPYLSEAVAAAERAGLWVTDVEVLRRHYAMTLERWWDRFQANREAARALFGERFCRTWEFYLAASEAGFRHRSLMVFQLQLAHRAEAVPLTRDYLCGE